jgi:hypothetical protein
MGFTPDRKAQVMESSTGGCQGRVCSNVYPLASLLARGYKPVRFRALDNAPQVAQVVTSDSNNPNGAKAEARKADLHKTDAQHGAVEDRPTRHHGRHG